MEYNKVAAKWWADKVKNVNPYNFVNGGKNDMDFIVTIVATMSAMSTQPATENIDKFEERLAEIVKERVEAHGYVKLSVDHIPDQILGNLAHETGVSTNRFPWNTTMWIEPNKVSVSMGYAAPVENIFTAE